MRFALNYSPQAADLLAGGSIHIDLFKCPDWPDLVADAEKTRPVYIHFPIQVGKGTVMNLDLSEIEEWIARTETIFVNAHFTPSNEVFGKHGDMDQIAAIAYEELTRLVQRFGAERVILENVPYNNRVEARGILPIAVDPQLISNVIRASGCGLLLDISHAQLACEYLGMELPDYIATLPVERLGELHVTGIGEGKHGERTDHMGLDQADWQRYEWAMQQIHSGKWATPKVVAFEYGGIGPIFDWRSKTEVIEQQVPRLRSLLAKS